MLPRNLTREIKIRLQGVKGQMVGLIKMIDEEQDPEKILTQFKSAGKL